MNIKLKEIINILITIYLIITIISCQHSKRLNKNYFDTDHTFEYVIIGSGPAGLQSGYYLEKFKKDYLILEKSNSNGSFFKKYPIHRKLISINKINTGSTNKDFNLRHDWNSLLSDDNSLLFKNYTKEFFPHADFMVKYLDDYQYKNNIKVSFNTDVIKINKLKDDNFIIETSKGMIKCNKLIIAAGLMKNNKSTNTEGVLNYKDITNNKSKFENKNVAVIGQGNAGFETANYLSDTAAVIQLFGRGPLNFAWDSHYPGHLRAVNNDFLDLYNLKSQHSMVSINSNDNIIVKKNKMNKYFIFTNSELNNNHVPGVGIDQHPVGGFDYVVDCTGFNIDVGIFGNFKPKHNGKVPYINGNFQSININNLFFAGALSQEISYKYGSAAFIHGFRYLASSMIKIDTNNLLNQQITTKEELVKKILYRINTSSALYQMYNCICDLVIINNDSKITYIEEINFRYAKEKFINNYEKVIIVSLKYGKIFNQNSNNIQIKNGVGFGAINYNRPQQKDIDYFPGIEESAHLSIFIHPVFEFFIKGKLESEFHLAEHLLGEFKLIDVHVNPLKKYINSILN